MVEKFPPLVAGAVAHHEDRVTGDLWAESCIASVPTPGLRSNITYTLKRIPAQRISEGEPDERSMDIQVLHCHSHVAVAGQFGAVGERRERTNPQHRGRCD